MTVRDREAPGSNPGPPTIFAFETRDFRRRPVPTGHSRVTISWTAIAASGLGCDCRRPDLNSVGAIDGSADASR